jgi:hypothetical protein
MRAHVSLIAALFLATGAAHADYDPNTRWTIGRGCEIYKVLSGNAPTDAGTVTDGTIWPDDVPRVLEAIKEQKRCMAWFKCLEDRADGKVKHCYSNDKRWREGW